MNEAHFDEIERVLVNISGARRRADKARAALGPDAEEHLGLALEQASVRLEELHRQLMQQTYFAVPDEEPSQQKLVA
jgi:hypothetical protein